MVLSLHLLIVKLIYYEGGRCKEREIVTMRPLEPEFSSECDLTLFIDTLMRFQQILSHTLMKRWSEGPQKSVSFCLPPPHDIYVLATTFSIKYFQHVVIIFVPSFRSDVRRVGIDFILGVRMKCRYFASKVRTLTCIRSKC